jgi:hypothetical protein
MTDKPFGNESANSKRYSCHLKISIDEKVVKGN